ncbi:MAG: carbamate kinase [Lachnospiraceae bacterium]|nr:carbamate kinase [Lachnospiraceae bacterium]
MKKRIVIALGHNALGETLPKQQEAIRTTAKVIADFVRQDYQVAITHSNGPQVSMIHTAMSEYAQRHPEYTVTPMSVCSAMSQGFIGYDLQNAIRSELLAEGIIKPVSTVITQVMVDPYDEAFYKPAKQIGRTLNREEADAEEKRGNHVAETEGGYRRVVATPKPMEIVELDSIRALLDADQVVIACGGGGIPVLAQQNMLKGAGAVIEKDTAAGFLADCLDAQMLVILTGVEKVCLNYGTTEEQPLSYLSVSDAKKYLEEGQFEKQSMAPKIQAAIDYIGDSDRRKALITKLSPENKIGEDTGTMIGK